MRIQLQTYTNHIDFHVGNTVDVDVTLGQPWHYKTNADYNWVGKKVTMLSKGKKVVILAGVSGELITMASHIQTRNVMKNSTCSSLLPMPKRIAGIVYGC